MSLLLHFVVLFALVVASILIARVLVSAVLRLLGVRVPVLFLSYEGRADLATRNSLQRLGRVGFVFVYGVLLWGVPFLAALTALDYVGPRYFFKSEGVTLDGVTGSLMIFTILGVVAGLQAWKKAASQDNPGH